MGITGTVGTYETIYGGDPNRIHNVQLVAHLVDRKLIAPGATFSFNGATGERTAAKGFLEAPVIINGELQTGLGGGVCQVSTTVFNAAYEAGLPITAAHEPRALHLALSARPRRDRQLPGHRPQVRQRHRSLAAAAHVRRLVSLTSRSTATPQHRRVETTAAPLRVVAPPPVEKTVDATLEPGSTVVDDRACPRRRPRSSAKVYAPSGKLLSDSTWYSSYRSEPKRDPGRAGQDEGAAEGEEEAAHDTATTTSDDDDVVTPPEQAPR